MPKRLISKGGNKVLKGQEVVEMITKRPQKLKRVYRRRK